MGKPKVSAKVFALSLILALLALSCSKPGHEYVGKWVNTKNNLDQFEIVANGDNYLMKQVVPGGGGSSDANSMGAVLKDGNLVIQGGLVSPTLTYVKATDTLTTPNLLGGSVEYRRAK